MGSLLLVVGPVVVSREALARALSGTAEVHFVEGARGALAFLKRHPVTCALVDVRLPEGSGLDLLRQIKRLDAGVDVIMAAADRDIETALAAMKAGAYDFLAKPLRFEMIRIALEHLRERSDLIRENRWLREDRDRGGSPWFGPDPASRELERRIDDAAAEAGPVLIRGELGTPVSWVAREIHRRSRPEPGPFVVLDCSAERSVLEQDLFGSADSIRGRGIPRPGKLDFAQGGTLFLDGVDRLPTDLAARLRETTQAAPEGLKVRLIACEKLTNGPGSASERGRATVLGTGTRVVWIPPLRRRRRDIPELLQRSLRRLGTRTRVPVKGWTREALRALERYDWPGNDEELDHSVEIMALTAEREWIGEDELPLDILLRPTDPSAGEGPSRLSLKKARKHFERQYIRRVLEASRGNQTRAAETLGLHRNTLLWKLEKLQMRDDVRAILRERRARRSRGPVPARNETKTRGRSAEPSRRGIL